MSLEVWMTRRPQSKVWNGDVGRPYAGQHLVAFGADDPERVVGRPRDSDKIVAVTVVRNLPGTVRSVGRIIR
jgi:hypothetical protein